MVNNVMKILITGGAGFIGSNYIRMMFNKYPDIEITNLDITHRILKMLGRDDSMIEYVEDRKGHDLRYSLDCTKLNSMSWRPEYEFNKALETTVEWYKDNRWWWEPLKQ